MNKLIERYGNLMVTPSLAELLAINNAAATGHIMETILHYVNQFSAATHLRLVDVVYSLYDAAEQHKPQPSEGREVQCKKGCSYCCNIQVTLTQAEAELIKYFCQEDNVDIDYEQMKKQLTLQLDNHAQSPHRRCAFLKNNECSIYEVRPFSCRNYFVVSPPKHCDTVNHPKKQVLVYVDVHREIFHSVLLNYLRQHKLNIKQDSIARTFDFTHTN